MKFTMGSLFLVMHRWQPTESVRLKLVKVHGQKIYLLKSKREFFLNYFPISPPPFLLNDKENKTFGFPQ